MDGTLRAGKAVFGVADVAAAVRAVNPEDENDSLELQTPVDVCYWSRCIELHELGNGLHPYQRDLDLRGNRNLTFFGESVIQCTLQIKPPCHHFSRETPAVL